MEKIGKGHQVVHLFKEIQKTNQYPNLIITDDLEVLQIAVEYSYEIPYLLYCFDKEYQEDTMLLLNKLKAKADKTYEISTNTYQLLQMKENHAGIIACISLKKFQFQALGDFIVVLDHLEIPGNIGTIYRTLNACKATGVLLVDPITKQNSPKLTAAARGTNLILPTISLSYKEAQALLLENQYTIYLGEPELGLPYNEYSYAGKIAIVVGNERFGINPSWYDNPHQKVYIPMEGNTNSLNVGVATSILAYEAYMKRKRLL